MKLKRRHVDAILFDKDGTLLDFQLSWAPWARAVVDRICQDDPRKHAQVAEAMGLDLTCDRFLEQSAVIAGTPEDVIALLIPFFPDVPRDDILAWFDPAPGDFAPVAVPQLKETLLQLQSQQIRLAVVTNDFESAAVEHVETLGVSHFFSTVIGYDSGYGGKPKPDPCLGAAHRLGASPEACVMVGDSVHDLEAGRAAGMTTVAVLTGVATEADLTPYADVVLPDIAALPSWIEHQASLL